MERDFSKIGFGYACISSLVKKCSTASTVPLGSFKKIDEEEMKIYRLEKVARKNLTNTIRLLWHNLAEGFKLYRFSSQLIPLGNHPEGQVWDFTETMADELKKIGRIVKKNGLRVSTHPGQYTIINARDKRVFENALRDLEYHDRLLTAMGLDHNAVMVTHVGGVYGDKEKSLQRFIENFRKISPGIQQRLVIENDDTSYSAREVLELCEKLERPMVLDFHHYRCLNQGEDLKALLPRIFATWQQMDRPPKVHFSSPASEENPRNHADYIQDSDFLNFVDMAEQPFDAMIEAKKYDAAVLQLWKDLGYQPEEN